MQCKRCGGNIRKDSKQDECQKCKKICPKCGGKKWLYAETCKGCSKNTEAENVRASLTWYLSEEEKDEQMARIDAGLCKFGCGKPAKFPVKEEIKTICSEKVGDCDAVREELSKGENRFLEGLSREERLKRGRNSVKKLNRFNSTQPVEDRKKRWRKRNKNDQWRKSLSESRKKVISEGRAVNLNGCGHSKACRELCDSLLLRFQDDEVYFEGHGGERAFPGGFRADFLNRTKKFIVEFNGDYWHCNPETWKADDYNRAIKMTASQKWRYDKKRHKIFRSCGYQVFVVWESDWMKDNDVCLKHLLERILAYEGCNSLRWFWVSVVPTYKDVQ